MNEAARNFPRTASRLFDVERSEIETGTELDDSRSVIDLRNTPEAIAIHVQTACRGS